MSFKLHTHVGFLLKSGSAKPNPSSYFQTPSTATEDTVVTGGVVLLVTKLLIWYNVKTTLMTLFSCVQMCFRPSVLCVDLGGLGLNISISITLAPALVMMYHDTWITGHWQRKDTKTIPSRSKWIRKYRHPEKKNYLDYFLTCATLQWRGSISWNNTRMFLAAETAAS